MSLKNHARLQCSQQAQQLLHADRPRIGFYLGNTRLSHTQHFSELCLGPSAHSPQCATLLAQLSAHRNW